MKLISTLKKIVFSRISVCALGIILQLLYLIAIFWTLGTMFSYSLFVFMLLGAALSLYIINSEISYAYKLIWVFTVLSFPIFGGMLYFFYGTRSKASSLHRRFKLYSDSEISQKIMDFSESCAKQSWYIDRCGGFPTYQNTSAVYYKNGEELFKPLLNELEKAEHYIFIEFFILENGLMWDSIINILRRKADNGVDVRIIYDDLGCLLTLPRNYKKMLEGMGFSCRVFGRLKPLWSPKLNNRDHRKMIVIDGKTAVTGGINLADEYINARIKHGYWKDSAVILHGSAVRSFTVMFLELWEGLGGKTAINEQLFYPETHEDNDGFVAPFFDSPQDKEQISENIYINMLNAANEYIYITTPYLIPDGAIKEALILASKNGVDVRLITPHIPDKVLVHATTRANYRELIKHGIRIYEFLPGFIHAKNVVSDDTTAVVGTVNLDFRSLYLHYECGVWLCKSSAVRAVKQDFMDTLSKCKEITLADTYEKNIIKRIGMAVLKLFSPLM